MRVQGRGHATSPFSFLASRSAFHWAISAFPFSDSQKAIISGSRHLAISLRRCAGIAGICFLRLVLWVYTSAVLSCSLKKNSVIFLLSLHENLPYFAKFFRLKSRETEAIFRQKSCGRPMHRSQLRYHLQTEHQPLLPNHM